MVKRMSKKEKELKEKEQPKIIEQKKDLYQRDVDLEPVEEGKEPEMVGGARDVTSATPQEYLVKYCSR